MSWSHAYYGHGKRIHQPSSCIFESNGDYGLEAYALQHRLGAEVAMLNALAEDYVEIRLRLGLAQTEKYWDGPK
jgi:hypothetical protein